jgi:Uma2 family endonuclease
VPDLFFVASDRQHLMRPTFFDGAPDTVVEFVSPDSQSRDRREKYEEYEKAGVREYWIIDPLSKTVELYRLDRKRYGRVDEVNDALASSVIRGFHLKPALLWRKPLPKVAGVLRQLASGKKS